MLKRKLRELRRHGRLSWLVNTAARIHYGLKNGHDLLYYPQMTRALQHEQFGSEPEVLVETVMNRFGGSMIAIQDPWELTQMGELLQARQPRRVLEIGTARGGFLFVACRTVAPDAIVVSVDLPRGRNGGGYPFWKQSLYQRFRQPGQSLHLVRASSHLESTRDEVARLFGGKADFIMIDGDHTYEGVKRDFELYLPLLAPDGVMAFHDILPNLGDPEIEIDQFWQELRAQSADAFEFSEIVRDRGQGRLGIGLLSRSHGTGKAEPTRTGVADSIDTPSAPHS